MNAVALRFYVHEPRKHGKGRPDKLLALVRAEKIHTFCTRTPTEVILIDEK